jgi:hypothetical protein
MILQSFSFLYLREIVLSQYCGGPLWTLSKHDFFDKLAFLHVTMYMLTFILKIAVQVKLVVRH